MIESPAGTRDLDSETDSDHRQFGSIVALWRVADWPARARKFRRVTDPDKRELVEDVAPGSSLVGRTVRETRFRTLFNAAVVAIRRGGATLRTRIRDVRFEPGDALLLEASKGFVRSHRSSRQFYVVFAVPGFVATRHNRLRRATAVFLLLVAGLIAAPWEPVIVCLAAALLMVGLGCVRPPRALAEVSLQVIVAIAAALGMSAALEQTGAASVIAGWLLDACRDIGLGDRGMLFVMILTASGFSQLITKNGAAALMFPVAKATADALNVHIEPFVFSLIFACGLSFLSPVAYQTNLMVYGPGGYRFLDFARIGGPLTILLAALEPSWCHWCSRSPRYVRNCPGQPADAETGLRARSPVKRWVWPHAGTTGHRHLHRSARVPGRRTALRDRANREPLLPRTVEAPA